ncbi:MAG: hypothetical protein KJ579_00060, partial [Verrucomicrobia bacterium]|nr:hypothetical protein [Verrucomicrobiota bacterium]
MLAALVVCGPPFALALPSYDDVLVVINSQSPESVEVGRYFQQQRRIPERNICTISITPRLNNARMTVAERNAAVAAIRAHLDAKGLHGRINSIVLTKGIAYFSDNDMLGTTGDNHLFDIYLMFALSDPGVDVFSLNPFHHYVNGNWDNLKEHSFTRTKYGFPMVTRIDGPGTFNIRKMIDATGAPAYHSYTSGIRFLVTYTNDTVLYRTNSNARGAEFIARGNIQLNEAFYQTAKGPESEPVMEEGGIMFAYFNLVNETGINDPPFPHWKLGFLPGSMITCYRSFPTMKQSRTAGGVSRVVVSSKARTDFRRADGADMGYLHAETVAVDPVRGRVWCGSGEKQPSVKSQYGQYTHQRRGGGLAVLDATNGAPIAHFMSTNSALLNDRVVRVAYDRADDRLWVASYGGIQYVDLRDHSFHTVAGLSASYAAGFDVHVSPFRTNKVWASFLYEGTSSRNSTISGARTNVFEIDKPTGVVTPLPAGTENGYRPLIGSTGPDTLWVAHNRSVVRIDRGTGTIMESIVLSNVVGGARLDAPYALLGHTNSFGERQVFVAVPTTFNASIRTNYLIRIVETGPSTSTSSFSIPALCIDTNVASSNQYHYVRHLAADPQNPNHVYLSASKQHDSTSPLYGLILRSTDGRGTSWETWLASSTTCENLNEIAFDGLGRLYLAMGYHNNGQGNISDFAHSGACAWGGGLSHDNMAYNRAKVDAGVTSCHWDDPNEAVRVKAGSDNAAYAAGYNSTPLGPVMFKTLDGYGSAASRFAAYLKYPGSGSGGHEPHMLVMEPKVAPYAPRPDGARTLFRPGPTNALAVRLFSPGLPAAMDGFENSTVSRDTVALFDAVGRRLDPSSITYVAASQQVRCTMSAPLPAGVYHMLLRGGAGGIKNLKGGALLNTQAGEFRDEIVLRYLVGGSAGNDAPVVDAGPDALVQWPQNSATLAGVATDDGLPSGTAVATWTQAAGPGTATFGAPHATNTTVMFDAPGVYVLRLTVDDGNLQASDEAVVTVRPESPTSGLVGRWDFEDATGAQTADSSGNGRDATIAGFATRVAGRVGKAVRLDGTNAVVAVAAADGFNLTERFTIAAWVLPEAAPTATRGRTVASRLGV